MWEPRQPQQNDVTLNEYDAKELRITKLAILKSAIEGGAIKKTKEESDEQFIERWIKYVYRNAEKDKRLTDDEIPF